MPTLNMPDDPRPASYKITKMSNVLSSVPIVGAHKTQTRLIGEEYHSLELAYDPISRDTFAALAAFLNNLQGSHTAFNVLVPQLVPGTNPLAAGNYVTLSSGRVAQVISQGNAITTNLADFTTKPSTTRTASNQFFATSAVPMAVYLEISGMEGEGFVELNTAAGATDGTTLSETKTVYNGRNFISLTSTASQGQYVRVSHSAGATVKITSIRTGISTGGTSMAVALELNSTDTGGYYLPGPATIVPVSLASNGLSITYGRDSFIQLKLNLTERQL